ncbi:hypothetical protein VB618_05970 [Microvirga sp. CF3062]|uniref:hypothetical protein n=1 Tax=Microvirga sp. CF3062 TaxID=3110182 RepID=UPI002E76005C|nr:hypothetical protein [Microvirga sp. CF3062]MEE1655734.1 hypothetical protein [Microvirga sp. CF3062]
MNTALRVPRDLYGNSQFPATAFFVEQAFAEHTTAVPTRDRASVDLRGVEDFPKHNAYKRNTRAIEYAIRDVRKLANYASGWDGYDAAAPNPQAISEAISFLEKLRKDRAFTVSADPDGSVHLTAEGNGSRVVFVFEGSGTLAILKRVQGVWQDEGPYPLTTGLRVPAEAEVVLQALF